jgi:hypothetical protein
MLALLPSAVNILGLADKMPTFLSLFFNNLQA